VRTRRQFLAGGAAAAAAAYWAGCSGGGSTAGAPNVLLIVVDTLRTDHAFGPRARTPNLDALSAQGVRFTRAFPEAMPTVPARNSLLSGRRMFPFRNWVDHRGLLDKPGWEPLADVAGSFTSVLRRAGWWTAYVTDNPFLGFAGPYEQLRASFDLFIRHGGQIGGSDARVPPARLRRWLHPAVRDAGLSERVRRYIANADYAHDDRRSFAARVFTSSVQALEKGARHPPFLLVADTFEPHEPWTPPRRYTQLFGDPDYRGPEPAMPRYGRVESWLRDEEAELVLERLRVLYAAEVTMTDRWMGALIDRLHELDLERDTVIVLLSDHGIHLGERGWTGKISVALHPEQIQVPLVIVDPQRRKAGTASEYFASTHDLGRTILSMAGVDPPPDMSGSDLSSVFAGRPPPSRPHAYGGWSDNHFVRTGRWAYMSDNRMARPQLFDLRRDPRELRNVAPDHPEVVAELSEFVQERAGGPLPSYG
jgi:arylsulfatase A-like enzyme